MSTRKRKRAGDSSLRSLSDEIAGPDLSAQSPPITVIAASGDLLLRLQLEQESSSTAPATLDISVNSSALIQCRYFAALLSDRWSSSTQEILTLTISPSVPGDPRQHIRPFDPYVAVLRLLHSPDFSAAIRLPGDALDLLPAALHLLFDSCVDACIRFLEAVPWSDDDEARVLAVAPLLSSSDANALLARVRTPVADDGGSSTDSSSETMLLDLINSAIRYQCSSAALKAFVAKMLREHPSRDCVQKVLDKVFVASLETMKENIGKYANPDFTVSASTEEREAIARDNLHRAAVNARNLNWLIDRMMELRVAQNAVKEWSEQEAVVADLVKTVNDCSWKSITPGMPAVLLRCTLSLASAVVTGDVLVPFQVRMKFVNVWIPMLNFCRGVRGIIPGGQKWSMRDIEETFLQIISTLPISNAKAMLQKCLSFTTLDVNDCPHLSSAFRTWFRRIDRLPLEGAD